jgi:acyl carrier protein
MERELLEILRRDVLATDREIGPGTDLFDLGLDSMAIMQLLLLIEDEFGIALDPTDLSRDNFRNPGQIVRLLESKRP